MKAEYFPPKEDIILQNEAPTDFYILVTGAAVIIDLLFSFFQFHTHYLLSYSFYSSLLSE